VPSPLRPPHPFITVRQPARGLVARRSDLLYRLRRLSNADRARLAFWTGARLLQAISPSKALAPVSDEELERWFGEEAPCLYNPHFGRLATGPRFTCERHAEAPRDEEEIADTAVRKDPRVRWEVQRDQDLAAVAAASLLNGGSAKVPAGVLVGRAELAVTVRAPNQMEAALRCVTWLELSRFLRIGEVREREALRGLAGWLLHTGASIERGMREVPLGGNHYLAQATGLLFIGRLMPGRPQTARWARRGRAIVEREVMREFHYDGGGYEGSSSYHLFSLELAIGAALLLHGQNDTFAPRVLHRLVLAARFASALTRPDATVARLGDDDSGRLHRWGSDSAAHELCALTALLTDTPDLAVAAADATTAAGWIWGDDAVPRLDELASRVVATSKASMSFPRTGLHVLRTERTHIAVWSRDPSPPAMLAHGHSDHNSVDIWCDGTHVVRDPATGIYVGDRALRNRLRSSSAHSTLTLDDVELSPFRAEDLFFMPARTRGRRLDWFASAAGGRVVTTHDGFRRLSDRPMHRRSVTLDAATSNITIQDAVVATRFPSRKHQLTAWWHWGDEPGHVSRRDLGAWVLWTWSIGPCIVELTIPAGASVVPSEPFPWSPSYGCIERGRRSVVRYSGLLPFQSTLRIFAAPGGNRETNRAYDRIPQQNYGNLRRPQGDL
jgi:hypothetical protein